MKKIISLCLVIALVATAIAGATLAYFTDVTEVNTNTFTVGDVDIKLDEAKVGADGKAITGDDAERVIKNTYPNVYPNQTVDKDPMVTFVKDSRDCYVRMIVTLSNEDVADLATAFPKDKYPTYWAVDAEGKDLFLLQYLVAGWDKDVWVPYVEGTSAGTYEFRFHEKLVAPKEDFKLPALFTSITFPADMTNDEIAALNNFEVNVVAHAMQAEGFETADNPMAAAWAAWDAADKDAPEAPEATVETTEVPDHS